MGTRAFSHDSIFIPDGEAEDEQDIQTLSQECIGGKVRSLQQQLAKNISFGQPPPNISGKRMQDMDVSAEEMDDTQVSPAEIIGHQDSRLEENINLTSRSPEANVPETERKAEDKVTPLKMSRHKHHQASSGTIESINLDAVPRSVAHLDNSAAKHKLAVKPKNQRVSKKHRGMSQYFEDTEYEDETVFTMKNSPNKAINYQKENPLLDINLSDRPDHKSPGDRTRGMVRTLTENQKADLDRTLNESKKGEDGKPLEVEKPHTPGHLIHEFESRKLEDDRNVRLKSQQEEEERKRQELEKVIWILEQQKENELKEQRRREEERKKRAEQCLKELEEHRKREEHKREREEQRARQKAETKLLEEHKGKQQKIEEQNKPELQPHEMLEKEIPPETEVRKKQREVCFSEPVMSVVEDRNEIQKMSEATKPVEQESAQTQQRQIGAHEQERRWQELEQGQKPFTFKVSTGEKQIIFDKVNLVPVSPSKGPSIHPGTQGEKPSLGSHALPSNQCVPHTAIFVTGAQLCDPTENTIQIKNTACKSLLGLIDEKKQPQNIPIKNEKHGTKQISLYTSESQENQTVLTELTSIRTKILRSEIISISDKDRGGSRICSDDWTDKEKGDSHSHLRKTMSASPRFSITPAWQKFAESVSSIEMNTDKTSKENVATIKNIFSENEAPKNTENIQETVSHKIKKQVTIDSKTESYYFSKDLPSFLVPNTPQSPRKLQVGNENSSENQMSSNTAQKTDKLSQNGGETINPFGIILRRTNYSVRFHGDPQNEQKKKKRYSAGDSFEGVSGPFMASGKIEIESHGCRRTMSASSTTKETVVKVLLDTSNNPDDDIHPTSVPLIPVSTNNVVSPNKETTVPRPPVVQKPSLALKPSSPTPSVSSPQSTLNRANVVDLSSHLHDKQNKEITAVNIKVNTVVSTLSVNNKEETVPKDKKYSFPSISIPWRDKSEKKPDHIGREKPVLQSRHSIDSRLMEKVDTAQPLWIMLALQKQKGFREQQANREDRRHAREAKQADKLAKENAPTIQPGEYRGRSGSLQKMAAPEEKTAETVKTRLQRREQLQKSNTLPTSATVDITENIPGTAQTKDNQKRFSTPNATAMSPEPDWMALAKRKSMAWKDSPQIIK